MRSGHAEPTDRALHSQLDDGAFLYNTNIVQVLRRSNLTTGKADRLADGHKTYMLKHDLDI